MDMLFMISRFSFSLLITGLYVAYHLTAGAEYADMMSKKEKPDCDTMRVLEGKELEDYRKESGWTHECIIAAKQKGVKSFASGVDYCPKTCAMHFYRKSLNGFTSMLAQIFGVGLTHDKGYKGLAMHAIVMLICLSVLELSLGHFLVLGCFLLAFVLNFSIQSVEKNFRDPDSVSDELWRFQCCGSHLMSQLVGGALMCLYLRLPYKKIAGLAVVLGFAGLIFIDKRSKAQKERREKNKFFPFLWHALAYGTGVLWGGIAAKTTYIP